MIYIFIFIYLTRCVRDGGLKRGKVKDSFKEEQQKMYSSIIVGQNGVAPNLSADDDLE